MLDIDKKRLVTDLEINKNKLVPGIVATWGDITGNISNQSDLVEYISTHGGGKAEWGSISGNISNQSDLMSTLGSYATESWVSDQGYITSIPDTFATKAWVTDQGYLTSVPSEYATQSWVSEQGYLTSETLPSDLATESWVLSQSYITSDALSGYATESWVSSQQFVTSSALSDYATQSWIESQGYIQSTNAAVVPLFNKSEGYLNYQTFSVSNIISFNYSGTQMFDTYGQCYVWNIGGEVYAINFLTPEYDEQNNPHMYIYKFNKSTMGFEHVLNNDTWVEVWGSAVTVPLISDVTEAHFLWEDTQGRVYYANKYQVNLQTGEFTEVVPGGDMGGIVQTYNGSKHNIFRVKRTENGVVVTRIVMLYASSATKGTSYLFNETTQLFEQYGTLTMHLNKYFYRYRFVYNGREYISLLNRNTTMLRMLSFNGSTGLTFTPIPHPVMPMDFTYDGTTYHIIGDHVRTIVVDPGGSEEPETIYLFYSDTDNKLFQMKFDGDNRAYWEPISFWKEPGIIYNRNGAEVDDLLIGFGYDTNVSGAIPVWRFFGDYTAESYGWDNSVNTRLTALEEAIGDAETITQNILGV